MRHLTVVVAMLATLLMSASGTVIAQNDAEWFTCSVGSVCVEYHIQDPDDRENFIRQCANHEPGRMCPNVTGCIQKAPGRISITYGGDVSESEFLRYCAENQGDILKP